MQFCDGVGQSGDLLLLFARLHISASVRFRGKRADDRIRGESSNKHKIDQEKAKSETGLKIGNG
ncbi:MAG: hypothetical protein VYC82_05360 [Verrucomicrobiota bacterium]|nr:hypothetical protein [Verrucomicrobiota bacterium]